MAYQLFQLPKQLNISTAFAFASGARAYFYATGTTTPQDTYSDSALTTPHAHPVVADAAGVLPPIYLDPSLTYKLTLNTAADVLIYTVDPVNDQVLSQAIIGATLYPRTAAEIAAAVTPTVYSYPPEHLQRYGADFDNSTDDTSAWTDAYSVAEQTVSNAVGAAVNVPRGTSIVSSQLTIPNHVATFGINKEGSYVKAKSNHTGPFMFSAVNGTSSMFDCRLERMTIDANNVAGLGCIHSDAFQEGGGIRDVLLFNYRTYGIHFENGYGGSSFCVINNAELFPSTSGATAGIKFDTSGSNNMVLRVSNTSIASSTGNNVARGIDIVRGNSLLDLVHFEYHDTGVYIDGAGFHVLENLTGGPDLTSLVEIASTFTGTLVMIGCRRNGATNLIDDNRTGGLGTITVDHAYVCISDNQAPALFSGGPSSRSLSIGSDTQSGAFADINAAAANLRALIYRTAGLNRWLVGANADAESGSDAGTNYEINYYTDAGSAKGTAFSADRTGKIAFNGVTRIAQPDYTITNPTTNRTIDVSTINAATLAQVVGTMIQDLINFGLYK